jgi:hypothetical protein
METENTLNLYIILVKLGKLGGIFEKSQHLLLYCMIQSILSMLFLAATAAQEVHLCVRSSTTS